MSTNINPKNGYQPRFHRTNLLPHKKISYRVVASNGAIDIPLLASNPLRPHPHVFLGSPTCVLKTMLADESTWMFGRYHYANAYIFSESPKSKDIILNAITSLWKGFPAQLPPSCSCNIYCRGPVGYVNLRFLGNHRIMQGGAPMYKLVSKFH